MAALSNEFLDYLEELEKTKGWEKLPNDDPRIVELHRLSDANKKNEKVTSTRKRVQVKQKGEFGMIYDSAVEAAEAIGMLPHTLRQIARGDRNPPKGFEIRYFG